MTLITETDYGTPASASPQMVTLEIDGMDVTVPAGTSIMHAAMTAGTKIPKLCATDSLHSFGSCRMCLVEIDGRKGTPASCTTPVAAGIKVKTQTPRLAQLRRGVMELYISDHPLDCLTCAANGDCELQDMAGAVGLRDVRYGYDGDNHVFAKRHGEANDRFLPKDQSNPYFTFDPAKCIVCSRCVRACEEVQGTFALTIDGRGFASHVSAGAREDFLDSECVSCGACVQACPTATLMEKSVIDHGQPETLGGHHLRLLRRGLFVQGRNARRPGGAHDAPQGRRRQRGAFLRQGPFRLGLRHAQGSRSQFPWCATRSPIRGARSRGDEAISFAAKRFTELQAKYGKDSIGGITSSRCTNEEVYAVAKMVRAAFRNNNVDTCARVCHSPTGYGLKQTFGTSAGTQDFKSVEETDVMIVIGANPTDGHPVFRVPHEEAAARGRPTHRRRSAAHRHGALAACGGGASFAALGPAPMWRWSTRWRIRS